MRLRHRFLFVVLLAGWSGFEHGMLAQAPAAVDSHYHCPTPPYPAQARAMRLAGALKLRVTFDKDGPPLKVEVLESSGTAVLDEATADFVQQHWSSRGLTAVTTKTTIFDYRQPPRRSPDEQLQDSFVIPETLPVDRREQFIHHRALTALLAALFDDNATQASKATRYAAAAYNQLERSPDDAPLKLLDDLIRDFEEATQTGSLRSIGMSDAGEVYALNIPVTQSAVSDLAPSLKNVVSGMLEELRTKPRVRTIALPVLLEKKSAEFERRIDQLTRSGTTTLDN